MKKIVLSMDDNVFTELRSAMGVRGLSGVAYGIIDEMIVKLVEAMQDGKEEKHFSFKDKDDCDAK